MAVTYFPATASHYERDVLMFTITLQVTKSTKQCSSCSPERQRSSRRQTILRQFHWLPVRQRIFYKTAVLARTIERTRLVSWPTCRNTSFNASHRVRPVQGHHRYCLSGDWPLISQDVHSPTPYLSFGTICLQKSCCAIRNIVLKDILRHSCLIAVVFRNAWIN